MYALAKLKKSVLTFSGKHVILVLYNYNRNEAVKNPGLYLISNIDVW